MYPCLKRSNYSSLLFCSDKSFFFAILDNFWYVANQKRICIKESKRKWAYYLFCQTKKRCFTWAPLFPLASNQTPYVVCFVDNNISQIVKGKHDGNNSQSFTIFPLFLKKLDKLLKNIKLSTRSWQWYPKYHQYLFCFLL